MTLHTRAVGEFAGSFALLFAIVGSNLAASGLTDDAGLGLLIAAAVTGLVLAAAIAAFQPVSGAHFNPAVTIAETLDGRLERRFFAPYVLAQASGAVAGTLAANAVYAEALAQASEIVRSGSGLVIGELLVTVGLVGLIVALVRMDRASWVAPAVGAYVAAGHFLTPSTGFANPTVTLARTIAAGPAGITPDSALWFVIVQVVAGLMVGVAARMIARR